MHTDWTLCPECNGEPWDPVCTLCHGSGILDYEVLTADRAEVCIHCGFPLYTRERDAVRGRTAATYCDPCGKVTPRED